MSRAVQVLSAIFISIFPLQSEASEPRNVELEWTGKFVGLSFAYNFDDGTTTTDLTTTNPKSDFKSSAGPVIGAHAGYNYQIHRMVFGIIGEINYDRTAKDYHPYWAASPKYIITPSTLWSANVRSTAGFLITPDIHAYGTVGLASSQRKIGDNEVSTGAISQSRVHYGLLLGAGFQYRLRKNLTTFAEFRHYWYESLDYTLKEVRSSPANNEIRLGVSYHY